ncbi:MAG: zinc metalloprotease HtpX [Lentisphaerae bacterium GWF2_52_8]|nr:MAG: zinc metalloprotease HtpX [Lentisphaerae bacterium GWF2_52_8]
MKRVMLFIVTNIAVLLVLSIVTSILGVDRWITAQGLNYWALLGFAAVFGFGGSIISLLMSKFIAKMAYSIQVIKEPRTEEESWLFKTVEDLAYTANIKMPEVGIYESPEANAFATGPTRNNSIVAVSSGIMRQMNREQLKGVLAHEVSHVMNGDMVTMCLLQGVLNTFVIFLSRVVAFIIDRALSKRDSDSEGVGIGYFVATFVCQIIFSILASLIVMAYSRHREFRADADAARLCGNRRPMKSALEQLKNIAEHNGIIDNRSEALASFKISGVPKAMSLFSSHPPLEDRIEAVDKLVL